MTERLKTLHEEYRKGEQMLYELDQRRHQVHETLLRISGAIQILQELIAGQPGPEGLSASSGGD
jgi:hypothetical protein